MKTFIYGLTKSAYGGRHGIVPKGSIVIGYSKYDLYLLNGEIITFGITEFPEKLSKCVEIVSPFKTNIVKLVT